MIDKQETNDGLPGYEIIIAGRAVKWPGETIKYEEVKEEWDKLSPDRTIVGDPPINYTPPGGRKEALLPTESVKVEDGLEFTVDPSHLS